MWVLPLSALPETPAGQRGVTSTGHWNASVSLSQLPDSGTRVSLIPPGIPFLLPAWLEL